MYCIKKCVLGSFPNLAEENLRVTSPCTKGYNCFAWAAGYTNKWWCPFRHWPHDIPKEVTIDALIAVFCKERYARCVDESLEKGFEKIVIYAQKKDGELIPTHAARQLHNGWWTSKLGAEYDIEHRNIDDLMGDDYGEPVIFMKRPVNHRALTE